VLVLNAGSNSLKFDVVEASSGQRTPTDAKRLGSGAVDDIGKDAVITVNGERTPIRAESYAEAADHSLAAVRSIFGDGFRPRLVVHRVVHGGDRFREPVTIDPEIELAIEQWEEAAPLHNAPALEVIRTVKTALGDTVSVAVFDTAFHSRMPRFAYTYALPLELSNELHIRRYGFHGVSHRYQLLRYAELNSVPPDAAKLVTLHLEGGSSAAAVTNGHTRLTHPWDSLLWKVSSWVRDAVIWIRQSFLISQRKPGFSLDQADEILNHKSGLLGVSGITSDTRKLVEHIKEERARLLLKSSPGVCGSMSEPILLH